MSEDIVRVVEELINSGKGDRERLEQILDTIKSGGPLYYSDKEYIESLTKVSSENIPFENIENSIPNAEIPSIQSSDTGSESRPLQKKRIAIAAIAVAIVIVAYIGLDVYAVDMLQFRPHRGEQTIISDTELGIKADVCNPSYFPASFKKYEINAFYMSDTIEKAIMVGTTLSPKSSATVDGVFTLNKDAVTKFGQQNTPFDPTKATITTKIDAPIFGVIPYTIVKEYGAEEFQKILRNGPPGSYSC